MNRSSMALTEPPRSSMRLMYSQASSSTASVKDSTKYEPARGSAVSVRPPSWARICWVLSAILALRSVGNASASSKALVCRLWVPPSTAGAARLWVAGWLACAAVVPLRLGAGVWVWGAGGLGWWWLGGGVGGGAWGGW